MYPFNMAETAVIAAALGVALALSFRVQYRLQLAGLRDDTRVPLFARITYAALSAAILCLAVVAARAVSGHW